jgi:large subunit ribosomal protein L17
MRHNVAHRKLGRTSEHRRALLRNQAHALLLHERIETTVPKAKELRPFVERLITIAKRGVASGDPSSQALHARRMVLEDLPDKAIVSKLFNTIAPRFSERPGGYTRILRIGFRRGDAAELAQIELVGSEYTPKQKSVESPDTGSSEEIKSVAKTKKGVGERLREAARRIRNPKQSDGLSKGQGKSQTRGTTRKSTTPRKQGGS